MEYQRYHNKANLPSTGQVAKLTKILHDLEAINRECDEPKLTKAIGLVRDARLTFPQKAAEAVTVLRELLAADAGFCAKGLYR